MFVYKIVRKIDGRYFSLYGNYFPRLNLEYKIKGFTRPTHGKIFVYPSVGYWPEYKRDRTVLVCRAAGVDTKNVCAYNITHVEDAVLEGKFIPLSVPYNAALCDYVIPVKELTESDINTLFQLHGMKFEDGFWKYT